MNFLIIEDYGAITAGLEEAFAGKDCSLVSVANLPQALHILRDIRPDLVIIDRLLEERNCMEMCSELRLRPELRSLPILILSPYANATDIARGLNSGADDYVTVPFDVRELGARISALLRRRCALQPSASTVVLTNNVVDATQSSEALAAVGGI